MSRIGRIIFFMMILFQFTPSLAATFTSEFWFGRRVHITLEGKIEPGDDEAFKREVLAQIRSGHLVSALQLNTPGGNVPAATSIGEQVRLLQLQTIAPFKDNEGQQICRYGSVDNFTVKRGDECECASACFLIWSSGIDRIGKYVGIHHPYFDKKTYRNLTPDKAEEMYMGMADDVRKYLTRMEIPDGIINKMFRYISKEMYYLNDDELDGLRNPAPWLTQLIYDRCGTVPSGSIYDTPERRRYFECAGEIHEAIAARNSQKYLDQYGQSGEKVPTAITPPRPSAPVPAPVPQRTPPPQVAMPVLPIPFSPPTPNVRAPEPTPSTGKVVYTDGPNANYLVRNNRDLDGMDLKPYLKNVDQNTCAQACTNNNMCQGFSYDDWNHFCILKTNITASRLEPREISGVVKGSFSQFPAPVDEKPHFQRYQNAYFQDEAYASLSSPDFMSCQQVCATDLKCVAYTYLRTQQTCQLLKSTSQYIRGNPAAEVGVKTQSIER